jgi:uncharacterized protein with HEPN domain
MPHSTAAYLADVIDTCDAIGEAIGALGRRDPMLAGGISHARLLVGFRNRLVHEYPQIDDEAVYSIAQHDVPVLRAECEALLGQVRDAD